MPVAEVANEQLATELAEGVRRLGQSPWRVQRIARGDPSLEGTVGAKCTDEPKAVAGDLVLGIGILLRIRHEDRAADVLDPERRVPRREARIDECADPVLDDPGRGRRRIGADDVNPAIVEVGGIQVRGGRGANRDCPDREALVDRVDAGAIEANDRGQGPGPGPALDGAAFGVEQEWRADRDAARVHDHESRVRICDRPGRGSGNRHDERRGLRLWLTHAVVQRGRVIAVVGDPPRAPARSSEAPGVHHVRVREVC